MELIQIIESSVFFFSLGLLVLVFMSYFLFKIKNRSANFPQESTALKEEAAIIYEKTEQPKAEDEQKVRLKKRFTVINETANVSTNTSKVSRGFEMNSRFYIYKPGRDKIVTNLQLSKIKD